MTVTVANKDLKSIISRLPYERISVYADGKGGVEFWSFYTKGDSVAEMVITASATADKQGCVTVPTKLLKNAVKTKEDVTILSDGKKFTINAGAYNVTEVADEPKRALAFENWEDYMETAADVPYEHPELIAEAVNALAGFVNNNCSKDYTRCFCFTENGILATNGVSAGKYAFEMTAFKPFLVWRELETLVKLNKTSRIVRVKRIANTLLVEGRDYRAVYEIYAEPVSGTIFANMDKLLFNAPIIYESSPQSKLNISKSKDKEAVCAVGVNGENGYFVAVNGSGDELAYSVTVLDGYFRVGEQLYYYNNNRVYDLVSRIDGEFSIALSRECNHPTLELKSGRINYYLLGYRENEAQKQAIFAALHN